MLRHRDTGFRLYLQSASLCLRNAGMEARDFIRVRLHNMQHSQGYEPSLLGTLTNKEGIFIGSPRTRKGTAAICT